MIDTHVHHWDLDQFRYPWLDDPDFGALRTSYLPDDYRADIGSVPVQGWVHVQAEMDHRTDPVKETEWVASLAVEAQHAGHPGPLACVVYADLRDPDLAGILEWHCRFGLTRGVRQEMWFDPNSTRADIPREDLFADPAWRRGYRTLGGFGLSFDLLVWPSQLHQAVGIAADSAEVPVVLEHLGLPDPAHDPGLRTWRSGITALAALPHAYAKLSAFSWLGKPRDERAVCDVVAELLAVFGPHRCMIGSNFPVERLAGGFRSLYDMVSTSLRELTDEQRTEVFSPVPRGVSTDCEPSDPTA